MDLKYFFGFYIAPIIILCSNYLLRKSTNMKPIDYVKILIDASIHLFSWAFLLFFLGLEKKFDTGWAPIGIVTLNIPFFVILIISFLILKYKSSNI